MFTTNITKLAKLLVLDLEPNTVGSSPSVRLTLSRTRTYTIKHYKFVKYGFRDKLVCLS
jgi:hypothetical protein